MIPIEPEVTAYSSNPKRTASNLNSVLVSKNIPGLFLVGELRVLGTSEPKYDTKKAPLAKNFPI